MYHKATLIWTIPRPWILGVGLPMVVGTATYVLFRTERILFNQWLWDLGLEDLRALTAALRPPAWFVYSLPNGLWVLSGTFAMFLLWGNTRSCGAMFWKCMPLFVGLLLEFGQLFAQVKGTFDGKDIGFCLWGALGALILYTLNLK